MVNAGRATLNREPSPLLELATLFIYMLIGQG